MSKTKALVVLSGGQDSTTCLAWAINQGYDVHTITFDYGQKHAIEIESAFIVAKMLGISPGKMELVELGENILAGMSPLTNKSAELEQYADHASLPGGLEKTFVPMRNQLFLTLAANRAYVMGCNVLVTGVCQEDSGGYPDCRATFIDSLQEAINYGTFTGEPGTLPPLRIMAPLMFMTKARSIKFAQELPGCMEALAYSHTSYDGQYPPTGHDHATLLRAKGFEEAGVPDPLIVRAFKEGLMDLPKTENYASVWPSNNATQERPVEKTGTDHVWRDTVTGKFHYSDEAEQIDATAYDTEVDAHAALGHYVAYLLGNPGPGDAA